MAATRARIQRKKEFSRTLRIQDGKMDQHDGILVRIAQR